MKKMLIILFICVLCISLFSCSFTEPPHGIWTCEEEELTINFETRRGMVANDNGGISFLVSTTTWPQLFFNYDTGEKHISDKTPSAYPSLKMRYVSDIKIIGKYAYPQTKEERDTQLVFMKQECNTDEAERNRSDLK